MFVPSTHGRLVFAGAYVVATFGVFLGSTPARKGLLDAFRILGDSLRGR
jgi:hypothetical protein